jgi:hypothetical protein
MLKGLGCWITIVEQFSVARGLKMLYRRLSARVHINGTLHMQQTMSGGFNSVSMISRVSGAF